MAYTIGYNASCVVPAGEYCPDGTRREVETNWRVEYGNGGWDWQENPLIRGSVTFNQVLDELDASVWHETWREAMISEYFRIGADVEDIFQ